MPDLTPKERARLLDPAHDPEHPDPAENYVVVAGTDLYAWFARADARLARLRELEAERDALRGAVDDLQEWAEREFQGHPATDWAHGVRSGAIEVRALLAAARIEANR